MVHYTTTYKCCKQQFTTKKIYTSQAQVVTMMWGDRMVKNLRKLRKNKGISQQQLADVMGTSQQSVNKYENHNVEPDISALIKLADYFETSIDYLVGHTPPLKQTVVEEFKLTKEETALICNYRHLSKDEKDSIQLVLKNYLKNRKALKT